jgi:hypothetical protein
MGGAMPDYNDRKKRAAKAAAQVQQGGVKHGIRMADNHGNTFQYND